MGSHLPRSYAACLVAFGALWLGAVLAPVFAQSTEVQIPVWAPAQGPLCAAALHLRTAGDAELQLVRLQPPTSPTIVFVVLDLSSSVDGAAKVRDGLRQVLAVLPPQTWVGLLAVNGGLRVLQNPTRDRVLLRRDLAAITPSGYPGLLDSVEAVESIADQAQRGGRLKVAIVAITDSDVSRYRSDYADQQVNNSDLHDLSRRFPGRDLQSKVQRMDRRLLQFRVPLFVIQIEQRGDLLNRIYDNALQRFSATLGGSAWFVQSRAEIPADIGAAFRRVSRFYLATVRTPAPGDDVELTLSFNGADLPAGDYRQHLLTTDLDRAHRAH